MNGIVAAESRELVHIGERRFAVVVEHAIYIPFYPSIAP
jgi:hypothetical protein